MLDQIQIVLVEPSHPGNVGAVARAMKTMGLQKLVLVNPRKFPHIEATKRAAGADDVLDNARVVSSIDEALLGCQTILGTSVREREVSWPLSNPKQAAENIMTNVSDGHKVAILFGRENSGLSNQELDHCQYQIQIPANDDYSSLNLASAVQIISYEIRMRYLQARSDLNGLKKTQHQEEARRQALASVEQQSGHLAHLQQMMIELDFVKTNPPTKLMRKLTRLYNKAQLTVEEIQILRGILTAVQMKLPVQGATKPTINKDDV